MFPSDMSASRLHIVLRYEQCLTRWLAAVLGAGVLNDSDLAFSAKV